MVVVVQCAASKRPDAGTLTTPRGERVRFVANPDEAPPVEGDTYARPDDVPGSASSWRGQILDYNASGTNPRHLLRAFELYEPPIYRELVREFGIENTYILSAGWGLIRADFLTPHYDITFSANARRDNSFKRRRQRDVYQDLCQLPKNLEAPVFFFGGQDYLPLFCRLTAGVRGRRIVFYNSKIVPVAPGCELRRYATTVRTNWHYGCARDFITNQSYRS